MPPLRGRLELGEYAVSRIITSDSNGHLPTPRQAEQVFRQNATVGDVVRLVDGQINQALAVNMGEDSALVKLLHAMDERLQRLEHLAYPVVVPPEEPSSSTAYILNSPMPCNSDGHVFPVATTGTTCQCGHVRWEDGPGRVVGAIVGPDNDTEVPVDRGDSICTFCGKPEREHVNVGCP